MPGAGRPPAILDSYHDEFRLHYFGHSPLTGDHVGKAAAVKTLAEVSRRTKQKLLRVADILAGPNRSASIAREVFERDRVRTEFERVFVYTRSGRPRPSGSACSTWWRRWRRRGTASWARSPSRTPST